MADDSRVIVSLKLIGGAAFATGARTASLELKGMGVSSTAAGKGLLATSKNGTLAHTALGRIQLAAKGGTGALSKLGSAAAGVFRRVGSFVGLGAGLGLAFGFKDAITGASNLEKVMLRLQTQAGASPAEVSAQTKNVLTLAPQVGTGPQDLAAGLYHIESNGLRASKALDALKISAEGAKVGGANLEDVTNALGGAIASQIKGTQNYGQAMGSMNAIVGAGDMSMQQLAESFGTGLLGPMKTFGVSLQDIGGALAVFGDNNIRGADAGTKLISAIRIMAAPSGVAAKKLHEIGMSTLEMANNLRKPGGLQIALRDLQAHLKGLGPSARAAMIAGIFGGKQSTGVQVLLGQLDRLKQKTGDVGKGATGFGDAWAATTQTTAFKLDQLKARFSALADHVGGKLIPLLSKAASFVSAVLSPAPAQTFKVTATKGYTPYGGAQIGSIAKATPEASGITTTRDALKTLATVAKGTFAIVVGGIKAVVDVIKPAVGSVISFVGAFKQGKAWAILLGGALMTIGIAAAGIFLVVKAIQAWIIVTTALKAAWVLFNAVFIASPIGLIVLAIAAVIAGFILMYAKVKWFRDGINAVWKWLKGAVADVVSFVGDHWQAMLAVLTGGVSAAVIWIINHFGQIIDFVKSLPGKVAAAASGLWDGLKQGLASAALWIANALNTYILGPLKAIAGVVGINVNLIDTSGLLAGANPTSKARPGSTLAALQGAPGSFIPTPAGKTPAAGSTPANYTPYGVGTNFATASARFPSRAPALALAVKHAPIVIHNQLLLDGKVVHQSVFRHERSLAENA